MFQPCLRAVAGTVLMMARLIAPSMLWWHPDILCFALSIPKIQFRDVVLGANRRVSGEQEDCIAMIPQVRQRIVALAPLPPSTPAW